jgi:ribonucleoside-diphosphate reductase alpha chain
MDSLHSKYRWLTQASYDFLKRDYLLEGQTLEDRVNIICENAQKILGIDGFSAKLKSYIENGWISLSTPIWCNFGVDRGLPISCFSSYVDDNMESILYSTAEVGMMTKNGGGTSAYFGALRPRGATITNNGTSSGPVHFMQIFETLLGVISQGSCRRGNFAAYLAIEHPDIMEFLSLRSEGNPIQDISFGVCVSDEFMNSMIAGDEHKRKVWARVLQRRKESGYPYIMFSDTVNNNTVDIYKDKNLRIHSSNLCSEILLPTDKDNSFVCDLSSVNLLYYDEWKDTDLVETVVFLLDAVMTEFIEKASKIKYMERAVNFAKNHRALGLGVIGWHSYLQSNMIAYESMKAKNLNSKIFKDIKTKSYDASKKLAEIYGEPTLLSGYGRRNTTLMAIAPTKSSAFIMGQASESTEVEKSNYYIKDLAKIKVSHKNPYLIKVLEAHGKNTEIVWDSILKNNGSVQHLEFLTEHERNVFKASWEISVMEVIIQAAQRQKYIDQGQSLNIMIHPSTPAKEINTLMIEAWKMGIKTLYYQYSMNAAQEFNRALLECKSCEG